MFAVLTTLLLLSRFAIAGIVAPDCNLLWSWTFNSLSQNPCSVAAYLLSTCNAGSYTISWLASGLTHPGPSGVDDTNLCKCSTVVYNLMSACDGCQSGTWITWSEYSLTCKKTLPPSTFPKPVPSGTRVPQWALLDPTPQNTWNNVTAYVTGDSPEVAPGAIIGPSNTSSTGHSSPIKDRPNVGAIAGGVIGGVAAISIAIVAVVSFVRRRRRSQRASSPMFVIDEEPPRPPMDEIQQSLSAGPFYVPTTPVTSTTTKIYDPNDPTTFPGYQRSQITPKDPSQLEEHFSPYNIAGKNPDTM